MSEENYFGDVIHAYTRADALADGYLVDVTEIAKEAGFRYPTAMTRAAWERFVAWDNSAEKVHQDESGRLWDVLYMAHYAIATKAQDPTNPRLEFGFYCVPRGKAKAMESVLHIHIGPGDNAEPVLTIMLPDED